MSTFRESVKELQSVLSASITQGEAVGHASETILKALRSGNKLLTCGNGGSAVDALHLAEELTGRYNLVRKPLPAVCLNADVAALTCIANDFGYESIFSRQVEALGQTGDVLVGFTTSGNSPNVIAAFEKARASGVVTILVSGKDGGRAKGSCNHEIIVPCSITSRIQEVHTLILHQWLEHIDSFEWG